MTKRAGLEDADALAALAIQMWTEHDPAELAEEFRELIQNEDAVCFLRPVPARQADRIRADKRMNKKKEAEEQRCLLFGLFSGAVIR